MSDADHAAKPKKWTYGRRVVFRPPWKEILRPALPVALAVFLSVVIFRMVTVDPPEVRKAKADAEKIADMYGIAVLTGAMSPWHTSSKEDAITQLRAGVWSPMSIANGYFILELDEPACGKAAEFLSFENGYLYYLPGRSLRTDRMMAYYTASDMEWIFNSAVLAGAPLALAASTEAAAISLLEAGIPAPDGEVYRIYPLTDSGRTLALSGLRMRDGFLDCENAAPYTSEDYGPQSIDAYACFAEGLFAEAKAAGCKEILAVHSVTEALTALRRGVRGPDGKRFRVEMVRGDDVRRVAAKMVFKDGKLIQVEKGIFARGG